MNPKLITHAGLLACIVTILLSCHSSQSTTYTKREKSAVAAKPRAIQLPKVTQELQVEVVSEDKQNMDEKKRTENVKKKNNK